MHKLKQLESILIQEKRLSLAQDILEVHMPFLKQKNIAFGTIQMKGYNADVLKYRLGYI